MVGLHNKTADDLPINPPKLPRIPGEDIFRRLTTPTLKKLYRFVLQRLVGRFLDDDIALEQLDVHLGAGRIELTDLKINVKALGELFPNLTFQLARAHVGKLRVEISYSKLLTESLTFFLDDVLIEIVPAPDGTDGVASSPNEDPVTAELQRPDHPEVTRGSRDALRLEPAAARLGSTEKPPAEGGESLDFLAQWIEQITSKVKIIVHNLTVRIAASEWLEDAPAGGQNSENKPYLELRFSSLKWCDETPDSSSVVTERLPRPRTLKEGAERASVPGATMTQKRLTVGVICAQWNGGVGRTKREVARMNGTSSIVIKHDRRPQPGSAPPKGVVDIDVSLRHADIYLDAEDCAGLRTLSSAYLIRADQPVVDSASAQEGSPVADINAINTTIQPLFREDFWYFDGLTPLDYSSSSSSELNFDTLSMLLEQYSAARARLSEAGRYGEGIDTGGSYLSLEQSDVFYDCVEANDDGVGSAEQGGKEQSLQGAVKVRLRMTGFDLTLLLAEKPLDRPTANNSYSPSRICLQVRRLVHKLDYSGTWRHFNADVGTFVAIFTDGATTRCVRMVEVGSTEATDTSPCIQLDCSGSTSRSGSSSTNISSRHMDHGHKREVTKVDVRCLPVSAVIDARWTGMLSIFVAQSRPPQKGASRPVDGSDAGSGRTSSGSAEKATNAVLVNDHRLAFAVTVPKVSVRLPADPATCSSAAYTALMGSIRNGTSPVGWTPREPEERAPALLAEVKDVSLTSCLGLQEASSATLECSSVMCEMVLIASEDIAGTVGDDSPVIGLYFLEASRSASGTPLKVDYGRAEDMGNAVNSGEARPADADLKFLHTWEPVDGVESGLEEGEVLPPVSFEDGRQGREGCDSSVTGESFSPMVLRCDLPRLAVELSRLEVVVLADILGGLSPRVNDTPSVRSTTTSPDVGVEISAPLSVEVMLEVRGATIVLHEAELFAEEPGPHSYVLNLGSACLRIGKCDKSVEGHPVPLVTVSSRDACVHETLRCYEDDERSSPSGLSSLSSGARGPKVGPLLFLPGRTASVHPSMDGLASIGFVPVLYQTKWAKGTSPITAQLTLALSGPEAVCKTITATLNLYDVSLRYRVASTWLPRLLTLVVGDVPPGRAASSSCEPVLNFSTSTSGFGGTEGNLTKMFITVFNGVVDYMPQMQTTAPLHGTPRKPRGVDRAREGDTPFTFTKGRVVLPIGVLRVSSNMVAGAPMQGFKVVIRDIGLHMSNRLMDYISEDSGLCPGALDNGRGKGRVHLTRNKKELSSVQEYLERSYFVQIATLNFLDAFLRTRTQVVSPRDAFTAVELWMGVLHVYTCQDSLSTSQALLGEWCALVNECRAEAADLGQDDENDPKPQAGQVEDNHSDVPQSSLLDDVEQDAFVPGRSNTESPNATDVKSKSGTHMARVIPIGDGDREYPGLHPREQQSLVIEDYYCVAVEAPHVDNEITSGPIPMDSRQRESRLQDDFVDGGKHTGGHSSFISEGEGPAQWLAAPMTALERGEEDLAMESAGESSDSEEEKRGDGAKSLQSLGLASRERKAALRNNFGFSLPAPIEIELEDYYDEDRHDKEIQDAKDGGNEEEILSSPLWNPSSPLSHGQMNESRPLIDYSSEDESRDVKDVKATHFSPQRLSHDVKDPPQSPLITPAKNMHLDEDDDEVLAPVSKSMLTSRQDPLALGKRADASGHRDHHGRPSSGYLPEVTQDVFPAGSASTAKGEILKGEQEARWLTRDTVVPLRSQSTSDFDTRSPSNQTDEFRVYPHYIPIPSTAEAASLPSLLSGDLATLQALGRDPQERGNQEAEADTSDMSERPKQKLQSQLAIHDLTICWRLFKGRDWGESLSADDRITQITHDESADGRRHSGNPKLDEKDKAFRDFRESQRYQSAEGDFLADPATGSHRFESSQKRVDISEAAADAPRAKKSELLDALLENYQDGQRRHGDAQTGRRGPRQLKVKRLNAHREGGSMRSGKRTGRDTTCMLEIVLEHSSLRLDSYHPGPPPSLLSNLLLSVKDLYASDTLTSSRPRKAIQHWRDDVRHPRQFHQKIVTVRMTARSPSDHFCPENTPLGDEIMLKVRLLPVHLSFGQHTVDFLRSFAPAAESSPDVAMNRKRTVGVDGEEGTKHDASPFFISCCDVGALKVKIDYQPRAIKVRALQHGAYLELLNLFPLEGVQLVLDKLLLTGVSGWSGVAQLLLQSWVQDITSTQLHKFLAGTTAIRPLVTVGKGVADLVVLPVEQYRRDRRVLRGLRKGTQSFLRAVTIETLHTSHRVASFVARTLDDIVAQPGSRASLRGLEYYDEQPTGVLDSLEHAYDALAKEMQVAAQTIIAIPYEEQEEVVGPHGRSYVRSVARALPVAVLRPVVGASEALSCTLLGFRNYMSPVIRKEEEGRWR